MVTRSAFTILVAVIALERVAELRLSHRNVRTQLDAGGTEYGSAHYPVMVVLHVGLLLGSVAETWILSRTFIPFLGYPMLGVLFIAALGRFWVIRALGDRWTTRVIVVPGLPPVRSGPYRLLDHPNYVIVVTEGLALPLVHTNWITGLVFTLANGLLLWKRIGIENAALEEARAP